MLNKSENISIIKNQNHYDLQDINQNQRAILDDGRPYNNSLFFKYQKDYKDEDIQQQFKDQMQEQIIQSNNQIGIRNGDFNRQKWISEQIGMLNNNQLNISIFETETDYNKDKVTDQSQNASYRVLKTIENPVEKSSTSYDVQRQQNDNTTKLKNIQLFGTKTSETNDCNIRSRQITQKASQSPRKCKPEDLQSNSSPKHKKNNRSLTLDRSQKDFEDSFEADGSYRLEEQYNKCKRNPHEVWITGFFKILIFVNRFIFRNKQKLIHFKPNELKDNQLYAINDLGNYLQITFFQINFYIKYLLQIDVQIHIYFIMLNILFYMQRKLIVYRSLHISYNNLLKSQISLFQNN